MAEIIKSVDYESIMPESYLNYALSVITDRALADVRDGLKPVQRRVLYAISQLTKSDTPHRKCARIVGDAMGKYHPHGDSSIYEALVNLAQNWKLRIPLIDGHGNFGSLDGSGSAAMRYTEARISEFAYDIFIKDLQYFKDEFAPNFDGTETEPMVMPAMIPSILVNGSSGIAVGMASNIPTHNLSEVIDATIEYMKNEDISLDELLDILQGPDFATGGIINADKQTLLDVYTNGYGKIKVRGKVEVKDIGYGRKSIVVTEIPFTMIGNTQKYLSDCADLVRDKILPPSVVDIADRGDKNGEALCIDVKKGTTDEEIEAIIGILYKKTDLESTFGCNFNCLNEGKPEVMGLKRILQLFTSNKYVMYNKKYSKLLSSTEEKLEVLEGLSIACDCIDLIIEIIRGAKNTADAKACLIKGDTSKIKFRFKGSEADAKNLCFTERQADAILNMRLSRLIGLEILALNKEIKDLKKLIKSYKELLSSKDKMREQIILDMVDIKNKYGLPRITEIKACKEIKVDVDSVPDFNVGILLDKFFYIKAVDEGIYEKNIEDISSSYRYHTIAKSEDRICVFASDGNMYTIKVSDIIKLQAKAQKKSGSSKKGGGVVGKLNDKGNQIFGLCDMPNTVDILHITSIENMKDIVYVYNDGYGKIVKKEDFITSRKVINASKQDNIVYIGNLPIDSAYLCLRSSDGYIIKIETNNLSYKGKSASGTRLISMSNKAIITHATLGFNKDDFIIDDKSVSLSKIKVSVRGAKGNKMRI